MKNSVVITETEADMLQELINAATQTHYRSSVLQDMRDLISLAMDISTRVSESIDRDTAE